MKIAFFYPSQELGGAEILVARLATQLLQRGHEVLIVDGERQIIHSLCQSKNIAKIVASPESPVSLSGWNIIAFASNVVDVYKWIIPLAGCRIIFWSIHPFNLIYLPPRIGGWLAGSRVARLKVINLIFFRREHKARLAALKKLDNKGALWFMDGENFRVASSYYDMLKDVNYLPIPSPDCSFITCALKPRPAMAKINIFWYGRICDFKVNALVALVRDISNCRDQIKLHIIGDGDYRWRLDQACKYYKVNYCFYGALANDQARKTLAESADLVVAMGTAALEAAQMAIATVLAPASYKVLPKNFNFDWLYNSQNFDIGSFDTVCKKATGSSILEIVDRIKSEQAYHGRRCKLHVEENHAMQVVVERLESALLNNKNLYDADFISAIRHAPSLTLKLLRALKSAMKK